MPCFRSDKYRCIFIHLHKTAGTSINKTFNKKKVRIGHKTHVPCEQLIEFVEPDIWNNYFKFTFIRNPWDRLVSMHFWHKIKHNNFVNFKDWLFDLYDWSLSRNDLIDAWGNCLFDKICIDGQLAVNFVGRFENLEKDFNYVCKILNCDLLLEHRNKTDHLHYSNYYDEESKKLVYEWHKSDIEHFGYQFESEP